MSLLFWRDMNSYEFSLRNEVFAFMISKKQNILQMWLCYTVCNAGATAMQNMRLA